MSIAASLTGTFVFATALATLAVSVCPSYGLPQNDWHDSTQPPEVFSVNRQQFEDHSFVQTFFDRVVGQGIGRGLVGDDRFNVDGTLMRSLAGHKSVKPIEPQDDDDGREGRGGTSGGGGDLNGWGQFKKTKRSNAIAMLDQVREHHWLKPKVIAADAGYGTGDFLTAAEERGATPHAAMSRQPIKGDSERHQARRLMRRRHRPGVVGSLALPVDEGVPHLHSLAK